MMTMPSRFCVYAICHNMRLYEPFFVLFLLLGMDLPIAQVGLLLGYQRLVWAILEIPGGTITDRYGRRRCLILSFIFNLLSYVLLGWCGQMHSPLAWIIVGLTLFGIGESLRSGTHKAIMLHWAQLHDRQHDIDEVMGVARLFSKVTAGLAAIFGGLIVWLTGQFQWLFYCSAVMCIFGIILISTYPQELDHSYQKTRDTSSSNTQTEHDKITWWDKIKLLSKPGLFAMLISSMLFESQLKVGIAYLQPYLAHGFDRSDVAVVGGLGGLGIGVYFLIQDTLAGLCATQGKHLKKKCNGVLAANAVIYIAACTIMLIAVTSLWLNWTWLGIIAMITLAGLQNLRRPLAVVGIDQFMPSQWRATVLSIESLGRCILYAISASLGGLLAQYDSLRSVYALLAGLMLLGIWPVLATVRYQQKASPDALLAK
ncbi:MAG TPA: hypothetical protein DER01_19490 [Phycisphaerales bacterium]|nr:hypothetical protein [Phycisphaerales bacterium]